MFLVFLISLIIILILIVYMEIPRYISFHYADWKSLHQLDQNYYKKPRINIEGKVVVSLTTTPDRIYKLAPTLCSILSQTKRVDQVRVNVPYYSMKGTKYNVPSGLNDLKNIKIYRIKTDLGPGTKLLPTAKNEHPKTKIIVIDDDNLYGSKFVETLVKIFKQRKQKEVITVYGSNINNSSVGRIYDHCVGGDKYVDVLFGCGGYILTPSMIPKEAYDYDDAPEGAIYVDDNWISGWLCLNGVKIYLMGMRYGCTFFPNIKCFSTISLSKSSNKNKTHEKTVNQWFVKKGAYR